MALVKDGRLVPDPFRSVADDEPLPAGAAVLVSLERWRENRTVLLARAEPLGVRLKSHQLAGELAADLPHLALIALEFPKFRDGRAFSTARELRERYHFPGEIQAVGHIIPDQYLFLVRAGVTSVSIPDGADPAPWRAALGEFSVAYQPGIAGDAPLSLLRRRLLIGEPA